MSLDRPTLTLEAEYPASNRIPLFPPAPEIEISLVIPTYNEAHNIQALIQQLCCVLDPALAGQYELIVVDDDSPDRTWEAAIHLQSTYPQLRVMRRQQERGLSTAVIRGWQSAHGRILGVIDGDLQHPPQVILPLWDAIRLGSDLAVASRHVQGGGVSDWSLARRIVSRGAQLIGLVLLPGVVGRVADPLSGFFLVQRKAIAGRELNPVGYKILIEVLGRGSASQVAEVGYVFQERQEGASKASLKVYGQYISHLVQLRLSLWPVKRFLQFVAVGLSGLAIDASLLYLLHDPHSLGLPLFLSKLISAELAITNNFIWNDLWTFREARLRQPGSKHRWRRYLKFQLVCLLGLFLNSLILLGLTHYFPIHYLLANVIAIGMVTFWNFYLNIKLSWSSGDS